MNSENTLWTRDTFPIITFRSGKVSHFVDDYRYSPGRTLCGRLLLEKGFQLHESSTEVSCSICQDRKSAYPTHAEWYKYFCCTDCGKFCWDESHYQVLPTVWELAYPGYNKEGIGVGTSRPCIGCLETRLGRRLTMSDFSKGQSPQSYNLIV